VNEELHLSIVIPAYNEQDRLPATLERLANFLAQQSYSAEVIVVDDGSTDATREVVKTAMERYPFLGLICAPHRGKGHTVRQGMLAARGRYVIFCDADLSMPPELINAFPHALEDQAQVAIATREGVGSRRIGEPGYRHVMGRVFNLIVQLLAVRGFRDTQCGFKGFTRESARAIFTRQKIDGFGFDVEVLYLARKLGYRVVEIPIDWYYQPSSRVDPLRDTMRMFRDVLQVRWNDLMGRYGSDDAVRD